jgi:hypothetical protein
MRTLIEGVLLLCMALGIVAIERQAYQAQIDRQAVQIQHLREMVVQLDREVELSLKSARAMMARIGLHPRIEIRGEKADAVRIYATRGDVVIDHPRR